MLAASKEIMSKIFPAGTTVGTLPKGAAVLLHPFRYNGEKRWENRWPNNGAFGWNVFAKLESKWSRSWSRYSRVGVGVRVTKNSWTLQTCLELY